MAGGANEDTGLTRRSHGAAPLNHDVESTLEIAPIATTMRRFHA